MQRSTGAQQAQGVGGRQPHIWSVRVVVSIRQSDRGLREHMLVDEGAYLAWEIKQRSRTDCHVVAKCRQDRACKGAQCGETVLQPELWALAIVWESSSSSQCRSVVQRKGKSGLSVEKHVVAPPIHGDRSDCGCWRGFCMIKRRVDSGSRREMRGEW